MKLTNYKVKEFKYNEDENSWDIEWVDLSNKNNTWLWCSIPEDEVVKYLPEGNKITKTKIKKLKLSVVIGCHQ